MPGVVVALHGSPVLLHLALCLDLLAPETLADLGRVGTQLGLEGVGEAVGRIRGKNHRRGGTIAAANGLEHPPLLVPPDDRVFARRG